MDCSILKGFIKINKKQYSMSLLTKKLKKTLMYSSVFFFDSLFILLFLIGAFHQKSKDNLLIE